MVAAEIWGRLTGEGVPCPVAFDPEDLRKTKELDDSTERAMDRDFRGMSQNMIGCGQEGWVPAERYEEAMALCKQMKEAALTEATSEEERAQIVEHWPWDDMDEKKYMQ